MRIVDAQVHLWRHGSISRAPAHHRQQLAFTGEDLVTEMSAAGVDQAVIVPPNWNDATAQNQYALECARKFPGRFGVMGTLDVEKLECRSTAEYWRRQFGMLGIRLVFVRERARLLNDGCVDWLWSVAERQQLPIMIYAPGLLESVGEIAERHPGLRLIVDHFGVDVTTQGDAAFAALPDLIALAHYSNVAVKASGAPALATDGYPYRSLGPYIRRIYDAFGPARMFWGTDLTRMPCSYRRCVTHFTEELPWLSETDKAAVMGTALTAWLEWRQPFESRSSAEARPSVSAMETGEKP